MIIDVCWEFQNNIGNAFEISLLFELTSGIEKNIVIHIL